MEFNINEYINYQVVDGPLKIENTKILGGANYFSAGPIVLIRLNLQNFDEVFTNAIPGFFEKLSTQIPTLYEHHCSYGVKGGFFQRVTEGTLLGHVIEHVAIEFQTLAGMPVGYGKTRSTLEQGVYNIIYRFFDEIAGVYAGKAAVNYINCLLLDKPFDISEITNNLISIRENQLLGPSTQAIVNEAEKRQIPYFRLDSYNLAQLGTGKYLKRIRATITSDTNLLAVEAADNKYLSTLMLKDAAIPVLETIRTKKIEDVLAFFYKINKPITIKPIEGYLGQRVRFNLKTEEEIIHTFNWITEVEDEVVVQPYSTGKNYRLLIIDYKLVAGVELTPPYIVGDGLSSIEKLIDILNQNPDRQIGDKGKLSKVEIDGTTIKIIQDKDYTLDTILPINEVLFLKNSGNVKLGGSSTDITDIIHPFNKFVAERAAKTLGLNVAGVDILSNDISEAINLNNGIVLEVNAAPDFRMHIMPTFGKTRNVTGAFINALFPNHDKTRIPLISITGTVGKTITACLINHCISAEGVPTGLATTEGLYIANNCLRNGDMTSPEAVQLVLKDPTIECAIVETSREGIIRDGLGYKFADIGIFLNVHEEHIGHDDIKYIEDLAYAKSVVAEEVYETGYSILNADNELILDAKKRLYGKLILFSVNPLNPHIKLHIQQKGIAVYIENDAFVLNMMGGLKFNFPIASIPLTYQGKASMMYENILATIAALHAYGMPSEKIKLHLTSFVPSMENLFGRMTFIKKENKNIFIDYAHNIVSFTEINKFLALFEGRKVGVIDATGERHDSEIISLGEIAGSFYDELYFYEGFDMRGRENGNITELLKQGAIKSGFNIEKLHIFESPELAWENGIKNTNENDLLVILTGRFDKTLEILNSIL
ncbi:MAG: cyanophycin synthetase [Bacteroidota bacterium]